MLLLEITTPIELNETDLRKKEEKVNLRLYLIYYKFKKIKKDEARRLSAS